MRETQVAELLEELKAYDVSSYEHSLRVGLLSTDLALEEGMTDEELWILGHAALLHDVGKVKIPMEILGKHGKLSNEEGIVMKQHVRLGAQMIRGDDMDDVRSVVLRHHEYQEKAYPRARRERRADERMGERRDHDEMVDVLGEIVAIADMIDALVSKRAYKESLPLEKVVEIVKEEFEGDPLLIETVLKRLR